jgi:hypothetical protein
MAGITSQQSMQLLGCVDRIPQFRTLGVGFIGNGMCQVLREPAMPAGLRTWIIFKDAEAENGALSGGPNGPAPVAQTARNLSVQRDPKLAKELLGMGLNCATAVIAGIATAGSAAAAPVTAGASTVVTVLLWSGSVASAAQCGVSTGRVLNEIFDPTANDLLDSESWYQATSNSLDAISVAGGLASLGQAAKAAIRLSQTTGRPLVQVLRGMSRAERKHLAQDLARYSGQAATRRQFIRLARQGKIPKVIRQEAINQAVLNQMLSSIEAGISLIGSGMNGTVRSLIVYFVEDE